MLKVSATWPANANIAPPGPYTLFVVDANGVPSVSSLVYVGEGNRVKRGRPPA